jgi:hypothetical protein
MKVIVLTFLFLVLSLIVTTAGALQCFAPRKLRMIAVGISPYSKLSAKHFVFGRANGRSPHDAIVPYHLPFGIAEELP